MHCSDLESCIKEIAAYYSGDVSGYPFIVNIDDPHELDNLLSRLNADSSKNIIRISDYCSGDNLPAVDKAITEAAASDKVVLYGIAPYFMLQGERALNEKLNALYQMPVKGHVVILLSGCSKYLNTAVNNDLRLDHRIVNFESEKLDFPRIFVTDDKKKSCTTVVCGNFKELLAALENHNWALNDQEIPELTVVTKLKSTIFKHSIFTVEDIGGIYDILCTQFKEIKASTSREWGSDEEWEDLFSKLQKHKTLSAVTNSVIGSTVNLSSYLEDKFEDKYSLDAWYLWLAMKVFGTKENRYLSLVVKESKSPVDLVDLIYTELLSHNYTDEDFMHLYRERKRLIEKLPEGLNLIGQYCDRVGQFERAAVYYLTDSSDREKLRFLKILSSYDYTYDEVLTLTKENFPALYQYLSEFKFSKYNTVVPSGDESMYDMLTDYFQQYKLQKLVNKIFPEFMEKVNLNAVNRPYNKLLPRISIVKDIDKTNTQVHFFDALGVEYLSYISSKCEQLGLLCQIHVGHCELPSITGQNIEFKKYFKTEINSDGEEVIPGTKELDELKHHSLEVDYTKCKEPIHLFKELEIIDKELSKIKAKLDAHDFERFLIISDHGASRLSVLHQSECELLQLEKQGEHSGRCCPADEDPHIPESTYENGFAVLANYDRFIGGRAANVEVHGGASLEETVIPVIEITKKTEEREIYITNPYVEFHNKEKVSIIIFSDVNLSSPELLIKTLGDSTYKCTSVIDEKHYKFDIPDIKRSAKLDVDLYDGNKLIKKNMLFEAKKAISSTKDYF